MDLSKSQLQVIFKQLGDALPEEEEVEFAAVARNASNTLYVKPALLATDYRVIFVEPKYWGIKSKYRFYTYEQIADVHLEKGWFTHKISITPFPGLGPAMVQDYLEKRRAEALYHHLLDRIRETGSGHATEPRGGEPGHGIDANAEKLGQLLELLAEGILTPEQYRTKKAVILNDLTAQYANNQAVGLTKLSDYLRLRLITEGDFATIKKRWM